MTRTYTVYTNGILVDIFDSLEKAENKVAEILSKYSWLTEESVYIK